MYKCSDSLLEKENERDGERERGRRRKRETEREREGEGGKARRTERTIARAKVSVRSIVRVVASVL